MQIPPTVDSRSTSRAPRRARAPRAALLALLLAAVSGCSAVEPELWPFTPPPNQAADQLLLEIPQHAVDALASEAVVSSLDLALSGAQDRVGMIDLPSGHRERILLHQVVTGMTVQEVVWCFLAHPTRVREQGPPGGRTLLWEPPGLFNGDRYWVRFDDEGGASAAGLY